jgi:anti-sigma regulatory factor (Ser/Thr protein kinase)
LDDCLELDSSPEYVASAREFVRSRLVSWEATDWLADAVLVASELVSNAILHARTAIELKLSCDLSTVRVEVYDENTRVPVVAGCPVDATSGRGLALVAALSSAWGIEHYGEGKIVWAEIGGGDRPSLEGCTDVKQVDTLNESLALVNASGRRSLDR